MEETIEVLKKLGFSDALIEQLGQSDNAGLQPVVDTASEFEDLSYVSADSNDLIIEKTSKPVNFVVSSR